MTNLHSFYLFLCYNHHMDSVIELYDRRHIEKLKRKKKVWTAAACIFSSAVLITCIVLCCLTGTANAKIMEPLVIGIFTIGGWITVYTVTYKICYTKYAFRHRETMLAGERTAVTGRVSVSDEKIRIKKSVPIRKVCIQAGDAVQRLSLDEALVPRLKAAAARYDIITLYVAHGYIVAYQSEAENESH